MNQNLQDCLEIAKLLAGQISKIPSVTKVALFGSVAKKLLKLSEKKKSYKDIDIALWLNSANNLPLLRRARAVTCAQYNKNHNYGFADHELDIFILEANSEKLLGFLCYFNTCPKYSGGFLKEDCSAKGCGDFPFLKQFPHFSFDPKAVDKEKIIILHDQNK
ncbi:MAG: hypothetical protein ACTSRK_16215 [Promethearchaeota archaeon]